MSYEGDRWEIITWQGNYLYDADQHHYCYTNVKLNLPGKTDYNDAYTALCCLDGRPYEDWMDIRNMEIMLEMAGLHNQFREVN